MSVIKAQVEDAIVTYKIREEALRQKKKELRAYERAVQDALVSLDNAVTISARIQNQDTEILTQEEISTCDTQELLIDSFEADHIATGIKKTIMSKPNERMYIGKALN